MEYFRFEPLLSLPEESTLKKLPFFFTVGTINGIANNQNWHSNLEFYYIASGSGSILLDSKYVPVKTGDFCVINPYVLHETKSDKFMDLVNIVISNDFCMQNYIDIEKYKYDCLFRDKIMRKKLSKIVNMYILQKNNDLFLSEISNKIIDFVIYLIKNHSSANTKRNDDPINFATGYIRSNITKRLSIEEISSQVGFSRFHLSRIFKKRTGYTIVEYINTLRCQLACNYLSCTDYSMTDIANTLNFSSYDYFYKVFKKYKGCSPREYKENVKQKKLGL